MCVLFWIPLQSCVPVIWLEGSLEMAGGTLQVDCLISSRRLCQIWASSWKTVWQIQWNAEVACLKCWLDRTQSTAIYSRERMIPASGIWYRPILSGIGHYRYRPIPSLIPGDDTGTVPYKSMAWLACNVNVNQNS